MFHECIYRNPDNQHLIDSRVVHVQSEHNAQYYRLSCQWDICTLRCAVEDYLKRCKFVLASKHSILRMDFHIFCLCKHVAMDSLHPLDTLVERLDRPNIRHTDYRLCLVDNCKPVDVVYPHKLPFLHNYPSHTLCDTLDSVDRKLRHRGNPHCTDKLQ